MKKRAMSLLMALVMIFSLLGTTATAWADDSGTKVPTLIEGVSPTAEDTVQTGMSYMMSDLHFGKIFWDNQKNRPLAYTESFYYQRSTDGGKTWSEMKNFSYLDEKKGYWDTGTACIILESKPGDYMYRVRATVDDKNFSEDTWTLTLHVVDAPTFNYTFTVSKDYNGNYPILKLYQVKKDENGNEVLGEELKNCFAYSNFTSTLPEGETAYDPAMGKVVDKYQTFYASLVSGRYAYRAFGYNEETKAYDIALGGMTLSFPVPASDVSSSSGSQWVPILCQSYGVDNIKEDGSKFTAKDIHLELAAPSMKSEVEIGAPYVKDGYTYLPCMVYAVGRGCLYSIYLGANIPGYDCYNACGPNYDPYIEAQSDLVTLGKPARVTYVVPSDATFDLYLQRNNFNTVTLAPVVDWKDNGDGTKSATYEIKKEVGSDDYTWRLSDATHVTRSGGYGQKDIVKDEYTFHLSFSDGLNPDNTQKLSHDFSNLGRDVINRDEADIQVNLDPSGYKVLDGVTRLRAYRYWELISTDVANIMVEPDFHWNILSGNATFKALNGGNAGSNWIDMTPGTQDTILATYYDSIDVSPLDHGSMCGLFPATNPERVAVSVVAGTDTKHGTADAVVRYNPLTGASSARPAEWDYSFDTWFYNDKDTAPTLDFTVDSTGSTQVEYAFVAADTNLQAKLTDFSAVSADESGQYVVPLSAFNTLGNGRGGTVILRMTDSTGVSYRLVRVAAVTVKMENVSLPGEPFMPGSKVRVTFDGLYRGINKVSGVFNPTDLNVTYTTADGKRLRAGIAQYTQMDNAAVEFTIPKDIKFEDGADSANFVLSDGHISGNMYCASNPFNFMYEMTDQGMPTNFAALLLRMLSSHLMDISVPVQKLTYDVRVCAEDQDGNAIDGAAATLINSDGMEFTAENGIYKDLPYDTYHYYVRAAGYICASGSFTLKTSSADQVKDGVLTIALPLAKAGEGAWDGKETKEPAKDESGVYQIGTGAELAWFAQTVNGGTQNNIKGLLTGDIELAGYLWTPIGDTTKGFAGELRGNGHTVRNLYISSTKNDQGLIGLLNTNGKVHDLTVTGSVITTGKDAAGIVGKAKTKTTIVNCLNRADVTAASSAAGVVGMADGMVSKAAAAKNAPAITGCGNTGTITATDEAGCAGGVASVASMFLARGGVMKDCFNVGTVTGAGKSGAVTNTTNKMKQADGGGNYFLAGSLHGSGDEPIIGTGKTADELMEMLKDRTDSVGKGIYEALHAIKDQAAADAVIEKIAAIGAVTLDSKDAIDTAQAAYDALTDAQKALVSNAKVLTEAQAAYKKLLEDHAAADAVIKKIEAIGTVTKDSKSAIDAAQAAYDALTDDQKALVSNYQTLADAALAYDKLVAEPDRDLSLESLRQLALQRLETLRNTLGSKAKSAYEQGVATVSAAKDKAAVEKAYQAAVVAMRKAAASYGKAQVIVENTTYAKKDGAAWDGTLVNTWVDLTEDSTMMSCVEAALKTVKATGEGFERNYISSINGLKEFDGSTSSGWMGTLNDWFTNEGFGAYTVKSGKLADGDVIRIMFTLNGYGADLGGSWSNSDTTLKSLLVEGGQLEQAFKSGRPGAQYDYTLVIDGNDGNIKLTPTATNKNFQVKTFLNEKVTDRTEGVNFFKSTETIPVKAGDTVYVGCGAKGWLSMNNQEGNTQDSDGTWYALHIVNKNADADSVNKLIVALPDSITYDTYKKYADAVASARAAYRTLTEAEREKVTDLAKLERCEQAIAEFTAVDAFKTDILGKLPEANQLTLGDKDAVAAAEEVFNSLTEAQKACLTPAELKKMEDVLAEMARILQDPVKHVEEKINAIGDDVTLDNADAVDTAKAAYDALSDEQKAQVSNADKLLAAVKKLAELRRDALIASLDIIYKTTGDYMSKLGTPSVGSVGGEWMAIGLARSGRTVPAGYYDNVVKFVQENADKNERLDRSKVTENARIILALTAIGKDVTNVGGHNLLKGLDSMDFVQKQGINGPIWTLIALDSHNYPTMGDVTREKLIETILGAALEDGGWAFSGTKADPDMTGMAIQALAPYYKTNETVKAAVDKALEALSALQRPDGGFGSWGTINSESCAQVIVALTALGIDPTADSRFVKNGLTVLDALVGFYVTGGGFRHTAGGDLDGMATEQGYYALAAYYRFANAQTRLYDMSDVTVQTGSNGTPATGDTGVMVWVIALPTAALAAAFVLKRKEREE